MNMTNVSDNQWLYEQHYKYLTGSVFQTTYLVCKIDSCDLYKQRLKQRICIHETRYKHCATKDHLQVLHNKFTS
jgi:hypothetical protein